MGGETNEYEEKSFIQLKTIFPKEIILNSLFLGRWLHTEGRGLLKRVALITT